MSTRNIDRQDRLEAPEINWAENSAFAPAECRNCLSSDCGGCSKSQAQPTHNQDDVLLPPDAGDCRIVDNSPKSREKDEGNKFDWQLCENLLGPGYGRGSGSVAYHPAGEYEQNRPREKDDELDMEDDDILLPTGV